MDTLHKVFGKGKKGGPPSPQQAIMKLRQTEEMLSKKSDHIETRIERELAAAKKHGTKNKTGLYSVCVCVPPNVRGPAGFGNEGGVVSTVSGQERVGSATMVRCREGVNEVASCRKKNTCAANRQSQEKTFVCVCGRSFRRQGDLTG